MATYVNDLRLKEIATGDESGTWGTSTNTNLELIGNAMGGGAEAIANASTHTITMADGVADEFRSTFLRLTGGGQACTVTLAPNTLSHTWIMRNETSATLTLTQGSGANVAIAAGQTKIVATDGAGSGAVVYEMDDLELAGNLVIGGDLTIGDDLTITDDLNVGDDINLTSDSSLIKFGADGDTTLTHTDGTGLTLNSTNKLTFGDADSFVQQSSDGVLRVDGEATIDLNASTAVTVSNDLKLDSDAAVLGFGTDNDVTLTHVADTGLLLNSTMAIQFNDASQFINAPSATVLDINATDEIELNATLVDVNANLDVSGTYTGAGLMTTGGNIVIPDAGTIGSASDTDALAIGADGDITLTQDLELKHDGAILSFGADDDVTLTHVADTGLLLNSTMALQFNDASQYINAPSNTVLDINATDEIELNATAVDLNGTLDVSGITTLGSNVGIGTTSPTSYYTTDLVIADTASGTRAGISIVNANDGQGRIDFADGTSGAAQYRGTISYSHDSTPADGYMRFVAGGNEALRLGSNYILMAGLPTSDPGVNNSLWNDSGTLKIS